MNRRIAGAWRPWESGVVDERDDLPGGRLAPAILRTLGLERPSTTLETAFGKFQLELHSAAGPEPVLTLSHGLQPDASWIPTVRMHSACLFGESFLSRVCECRAQLDASLAEVARRGGVIAYLFQEGRGIGLCGKMLAMELERVRDMSTVEAFRALHHDPDPRSYAAAAAALRAKISTENIRLITNNPFKLAALASAGFNVVERVELPLRVSRSTAAFVAEKQRALGHIPFQNIEIVDAP